jgi:tetraacyldisaccharide 4'-kinase
MEGGDEPFLLATNLLGIAAVISNPNRVAAGEWAIENFQSEVFVLDDGFQHLRLYRDLDIVAIDATNPQGVGGGLQLLGSLRESLSGLSRADCVIITRTDQVGDVAVIRDIVQRNAGNVPVFSSRMLTSRFRRLGGEPMEMTTYLSRPIGAFCGVGNPDSFFTHLRDEGFQLEFTRTFPDHHRYTQTELDVLIIEAKAAGVTSLLTTAKDATKLGAFKLEIPCCVLEIQISIDEEDRVVDLIRKAIAR